MVIFPFGILNEKKSSGNYNSCHCINDNWIHCIHFLSFLGFFCSSSLYKSSPPMILFFYIQFFPYRYIILTGISNVLNKYGITRYDIKEGYLTNNKYTTIFYP